MGLFFENGRRKGTGEKRMKDEGNGLKESGSGVPPLFRGPKRARNNGR
jgi:hypothetical protein